jgi:hypothetical protein
MTCWVSGFGYPDQNTKNLTRTISEIHVPLVNHSTCQQQLIATKLLGNDFKLDARNFLCAGGELQQG